MRRVACVGVVLVYLGSTSGCVQEAAPTVEYFRAHPKERAAQLKQCADDPGSLQDSARCVNALQAKELERKDSLRTLPSMGLPQEPQPSEAQPEIDASRTR
jgi:hypothetical protein